MSKSGTEARGWLGYYLPEDSQFRLRKLQQHMVFLSRLAEPRMNEEEDGPEIAATALAGCLELLAEQVEQVLDTVAWPARLEAKGKRLVATVVAEETDDANEEDEEEEAEEEEEEDEEDGQEEEEDEAEDEDDEAASIGIAAAYSDDYDFGMTLDQVDEANRLLDLLAAQGDLLMAGGGGDFAQGTITVIGASVFESADAVHAIIRQVGAQALDAPAAKRSRVREMPAAYGMAGGMARVH